MANEVYFWNRIGKEEETPLDAEKTSFTIERAVLITPPKLTSTQSNSLYLILSKDNEKKNNSDKDNEDKTNSEKNNLYRYGMHDLSVGNESVIAPFLNKMGIKYSKEGRREVAEEVRELEGKKIIGYFKIEEDVKSFINGVSIQGEDRE